MFYSMSSTYILLAQQQKINKATVSGMYPLENVYVVLFFKKKPDYQWKNRGVHTETCGRHML